MTTGRINQIAPCSGPSGNVTLREEALPLWTARGERSANEPDPGQSATILVPIESWRQPPEPDAGAAELQTATRAPAPCRC